jgi:hypothetical protein
VRSETRVLARDLIVEMNCVTQSERPEITLVVFWPSQSSIYHHSTSGSNGILDRILGNSIVVMSSYSAMPDALAFGGELGRKLLRGIDTIAGTVGLDLNAGRCSFFSKHCFGPGQPNLVNDGKL